MSQPQQQAPPIDLKNTTEVKNFNGGSIFQQGVILRKVSRFVTGTDEDALLPIPVFYDPEKKMIYSIYKEFIPKNNRWNKYIKSKVKQPNLILIDNIKDYFKCSSKESKEYINILDTPKINRILTEMGIDKKEITKILK